jgi:integration host factor subunit alpha
MTKADLIESIYSQLHVPKKESSDIVELVIESLKEAVANGENVKISGFGTFHVRQKKTRKGRNPKTGASMQIAARRVLSFRAGQQLKHALNAPTGRAGANGAAAKNGAAGKNGGSSKNGRSTKNGQTL